MATSKANIFWTLVTILLVIIIIAGGIFVWARYTGNQPAEIFIASPSHQEQLDSIYIGGAVTNPGFYPVQASDSVEALIQAAGGTTSFADPGRLKIYVPTAVEDTQPQRIDINRAEAWLLEALPGIGEIRARAIIDYRHQQGLFRNINELTRVEGIGIATYEKIKDSITVAD
jgi:competence protein ComEA